MKQKKWLVLAAVVAVLAALAVVFFCLHLPTSPGEAPMSSRPVAATTATTTTATQTPTTSATQAVTTTTTKRELRLDITSHRAGHTSTDEPTTVFKGTSDPAHPLTVNGETVQRTADGAFALEYSLTPGDNTFRFTHKGETVTYTVRYNYVVIRSHSPSNSRRLKSGSVLSVVVTARSGSTVKATFNGKTVTLQEDTSKRVDGGDGTVFADFTGSFTLPGDNTKDLNLGKVKFTATHNGYKNTAQSGTITCEKVQLPTIAEIVTFSAETFNGNTADDDSRPTNNYLPEGTVDYVVGRTYYGEKEYLKLRCGRRVYVSKKDDIGNTKVTVAKEYAGKLPSTNQLSVAKVEVTQRATTLTLNTAWKAPFLLDLLPQTYTDPGRQDYTVSQVTCEYVEITFCYADAFSGSIDFVDNHPLFTRATVTKGKDTCTLRLYLRRRGGFYGWDASYNKDGQLVFWFLHPVQVSEANNAYGADLTGVTVMLDVGHGGKSPGAAGLDSQHPESERNLYLAGLIREELESMGATVVLNRTGDTTIYNDDRCQQLKALKPDLCIAIHHDSNASSRPNGFGSFHSTLFSREAARYIYEATMATGIYNSQAPGNRNRFEWHYYFVARMTDCPVVLTENGFMSSQRDHPGIISPAVNRQKAKAIAAGVARYFLSIRQPDLPPLVTTTTTTSHKETTTATEVETTITADSATATTGSTTAVDVPTTATTVLTAAPTETATTRETELTSSAGDTP
ncbi:MAG: N-acetylmuramoyl-L-alanine amidase [Clostridia bacterium]|nr:N-acetylmuramoyl-L-alanine amidase [Clostridia bacterium]